MTFQPGSRRPARSGVGSHAGVDDGDDDAGAAASAPRPPGPDGVETPLLRAARIGQGLPNARRRRERLGVAHGARAAQRAQGGAPTARRDAHDDDSQARRRRRSARPRRHPARVAADRARPQADHDRVVACAAPGSAQDEQHEQSGEDGQRAAEVRSLRHGGSVADGSRDGARARRAGCVTLRRVEAASPHVRRVARAGVLALCDRLDAHARAARLYAEGTARFETAEERVTITPPFRVRALGDSSSASTRRRCAPT